MHVLSGRGQQVAVCAVAAFLLVASGSYVSTTDWWIAKTVQRSVVEELAAVRPTVGRLSGIPYALYSESAPVSPELERASLAVLTLPADSRNRLRLQAYLDIASRRWESAVERLEALRNADPGDPGLVNDLGVVYLEMAKNDASYLIEALSAFEIAAQDWKAEEPIFNIALTYRLLHLPRKSREAAARFLAIAQDPRWEDELDQSDTPTEMEVLQSALAGEDVELARAVAERTPDALWRIVTDLVLNPSAVPSGLHVLESLIGESDRPQDATLDAILGPLSSPERSDVVAIRLEVLRTADIHSRDVKTSVRMAEQLKRRVTALDSEFDRLWVDLVHAEAMIWNGDAADLSEARNLLDSVIANARRLKFRWIIARALTVYGSHPHLTSRVEVIRKLEDAIEIYEDIGALTESVRARVNLAMYLWREGSHRESFNRAIAALALTYPSDHRQRYQIHSTLSRNPMLGRSPLAVSYLEETSEQARSAELPAGEVDAYIALAELYEDLEQPALSDRYLDRAESAMQAIGSARERDLIASAFTLGKARILISRRQTADAERLLLEGLASLESEAVDIEYLQQYHLALGNAYIVDGRLSEAGDHYGFAVAAVEQEDDQLGATVRLFFDDERREIYETAIDFELHQGAAKRALHLARQYRAKLIAESMGPLRSLSSASAVPADLDRLDLDALGTEVVLEYAVLEDRIVVWVFSRSGFEHRSVELERETFDAEVGRLLDLIHDPEETAELDELSRHLYGILIEPVRDLVDDADRFAIIPDRMLHRLPFGALRAPDGKYLVETHEFTVTLDLGYFLAARAEHGESGKLVAFGSHAADTGIQRELYDVERFNPGIEIVDGFEVTKAAFLDGSDGAALVHYAGHAAFDRGNSRTSSIQLDGEPGGPNAISASEIAAISLAPDALVVLSSCDSSIGNSIGGLEYRGLTSAFLSAGAGTVVGSLWQVETNATADLMGYFYRNLAAGDSVARALRNAQLALMKQYPHPYYWSSFTVTGNRSALEAPMFATGSSLTAAAGPYP